MAMSESKTSASCLDRRRMAIEMAANGSISAARKVLCVLAQESQSSVERAALISDLSAISAAQRRFISAERGWQRALRLNPNHAVAQRNLSVLASHGTNGPNNKRTNDRRVKIAILSLLFNWPSTGGGTVHTKEVADALQADGYDVLHIFAVYSSWGVGNVTEPLSVPTVPICFREDEWTPDLVQERFREAVDEFAPDGIIITDSWNTKPLLAEAVADYPYFLRLAALETLCPLNNVRLLFEDGCLVQCLRNQLADQDSCQQCVKKFSRYSGSLHQAERALGGFEEQDYPERLRRAYRGAEAVLVVNPEIADLVRPFCRRVEVIPSGFDPRRFPEPDCQNVPVGVGSTSSLTRFIFAGLVDEPMKGFSVLFAACQRLWSERQDFELIVTSEPRSDWNAPFVRWIGWQTQAQLPDAIRSADVLVFPTIAQEALGRTAVEAMGCGKPVIASRLGGLPWVVEDEVTGLMVTPGDLFDLAVKMKLIMNDELLRHRLGQAGREKFTKQFPWPVILEQHYRPLLQRLIPQSAVVV